MSLGKYNIDYFIGLNKSYIGCNMSYQWIELKNHNIDFNIRNFNGGLSLRKREDMIKVITNFPPQPTNANVYDNFKKTPEDVYFVIGCCRLGLPVSNDEETVYFGLHTIYKDEFFGIHQPCGVVKEGLKNNFGMMKYINRFLKFL
jgi:hypothetical protein